MKIERALIENESGHYCSGQLRQKRRSVFSRRAYTGPPSWLREVGNTVLLNSANIDQVVPAQLARENASDATAPPYHPPWFGITGRSEFKFVLLFALTLCMLTTVPYIAGHRASFKGTAFTDVLVHSYDSNNYLAYANQSASGRWLFRNPMTAEPHQRVFFNLEWLLIGKISFLLRISLPTATNVLRLLCLALTCFSIYWLSSFLFASSLVRRIAVVAVMTGGGFGWVAALHVFHIPIDSSVFLDLSNGNLLPYYWALKLPHFLISESCVVLGFCAFLGAENSRRVGYYIAAGVFYMCAGACRPYDMLFLMTATSVFLALSCFADPDGRWQLGLRAVPVLMCVPLLGYYYWIFKIHPIFRWWSLPGNPAPSPLLLLLAFGMTSIFLPFAIWKLAQKGLSKSGSFMLCCLVTAILFAYMHRLLHFSFQFATNIFIPLVMITLLGMEDAISAWTSVSRSAKTVIIALLAVNSFTSIALTGQAALLAARGEFRVDKELLEAYAWLDAHSHTDDLILADFDNSSNMPQYTHDVVYCGYENAVNFHDKLSAEQEFFDSHTPNAFRDQFIHQNRIQFLLVTSQEERQIATLGDDPFLQVVFRNGVAVIFSVGKDLRYTDPAGSSRRIHDVTSYENAILVW